MIQIFKKLYNKLKKNRLAYLKTRLKWKKKELEVKADIHDKSHSLLWVWEFSKKAVLICFIFYMIVQIYSMVVMIIYQDFTHLGELINQTGQIVQNCVFGYLIKAGIENVGKIFFGSNEDEAVG